MATFVEFIPQPIAGLTEAQGKIVKVKGQLDESNVDEKSKEIYQIVDTAPEGFSLIFDLAELEYMNSKAVGYLTDWYTKLTDKKGKIMIVGAPENILDILQVVGLTQLIQTYPTLDEARVALNITGDAAAAPAAPATPEAPAVPQGAVSPAPAATPEAAAPVAAPEPTAAPVAETSAIAPEAPAATPEAPVAPTPEQPAAPEAPAATPETPPTEAPPAA